MSEEYIYVPPLSSKVFAEIRDLLPEGELSTYWESLMAIERFPKEDPIILAALKAGVVTVVARRVPQELAEERKRIEDLMSNQSMSKIFEARFDRVRDECKEVIVECKTLRDSAQRTERALKDFWLKVDQMVQNKVAAAVQSRSKFEALSVSALWLIVGLVLGITIGLIIPHLVSFLH